jgi:hypothetical protein
MESSPAISSFVIRIIQDPSANTSIPLRGSILHVQSNQELTFTKLSDAVEFINEFTPFKSLDQNEESNRVNEASISKER